MARGALPRNQGQKCAGRAVVRYPKDYKDPTLRSQPILDPDGRKQYRPCQAWAMHGSTVCDMHGGNAPQVIAEAKKNLALATRNISDVLIDIALDERQAPDVRIKAAVQVMDRAGIRSGVDLGIEIPKWQDVLGQLFGSTTPDVDSEAFDPQPDRGATVVEFVAVEESPPAKPARRKAAPRKASAKKAAPPKFEGW